MGEAPDVLVAVRGREVVLWLISSELDVHPVNETINKKVNKDKCPERFLNAIFIFSFPGWVPNGSIEKSEIIV